MGIKRNFIFSTVLTASNYIFPFIIYPYVARVLGATNVGIVNFVNSIVTYATMISMMGIAVVGIREIAKSKHDKTRLNRTFTALCAICTAFTIVATIALVGVTYLVPEFAPYKPMLLIGILKLWSNFLLIEWLYKGLEDFKFITVRTIIVKMAYLVSVFVLIHTQSDYVLYFLLMTLMITANSAFNCYRAMELVQFDFCMKYVKHLIRPVLTFGIYLMLNSMYTTFNILYLGLEKDDTQVGYYTTATKIFNIILAVYTAYSGVVMPRVSALLAEKKFDEFKILISKSIQALLLISVPVAVFGMIFSSGLVYLIAGAGFTGSILPMTIVMPLIFIIGYEQILVMQTLTPLASDKVILLNSVVGATVGVLANILLVGRYAAVGSAIVWIIAEISVLVMAQFFVKKKVGLAFPFKSLAVNMAAYIPYAIAAYAATVMIPGHHIVKMLIGGVVMLPYFYLVQRFFLRNELFTEYHGKIAAKIKKTLNRA